jgi:hypothetical protein
MAAQNPLFPSTIEAQVSDLHTKLDYLHLNEVRMRLNVTEQQASSLQAATMAVDVAHMKAENKDTRTKIDVFNRTEAIKEAHVVFRKVINICVANNPSALPADYVALSVPHPAHHAPLPAPATYPDFTVDSSVLRRLSVVFHDHGSEKRGKPHGVSGAVVRWAMLDTPPAGVEDLTSSALDSASPYTLDFTEAQRGRRVYFCLAWQNPKGEKGPWSEIVGAVVP